MWRELFGCPGSQRNIPLLAMIGAGGQFCGCAAIMLSPFSFLTSSAPIMHTDKMLFQCRPATTKWRGVEYRGSCSNSGDREFCRVGVQSAGTGFGNFHLATQPNEIPWGGGWHTSVSRLAWIKASYMSSMIVRQQPSTSRSTTPLSYSPGSAPYLLLAMASLFKAAAVPFMNPRLDTEKLFYLLSYSYLVRLQWHVLLTTTTSSRATFKPTSGMPTCVSKC